MSALPVEAARILDRGASVALAANVPGNPPHVTPLVHVWTDEAVWVTTARGSVKARAWGRDPRVAGLARVAGAAVAFTGRVRTYDVLEPATWAAALRDGPSVARASAAFAARNARFFAGYAVDARHVPLAWTPPGRVFVRVELDGGAVLRSDGTATTWGSWDERSSGSLGSEPTYRIARSGAPAPLAGVPVEVVERLGAGGEGALGLGGPTGPRVVPVRWAVDERELWAAGPAALLSMAVSASAAGPTAGEAAPGPPSRTAASLCADRAITWRAREAVGVLTRGEARIYVPGRLGSGATSATRRIRAAGGDPHADALVRIVPDRLVWWAGWSSGTVRS